MFIFATCCGKKGLAKLKLHAEEQNLVKYENVALFSYGSQEQNRYYFYIAFVFMINWD